MVTRGHDGRTPVSDGMALTAPVESVRAQHALVQRDEQSFEQMMAMAKVLVSTGFLPKAITQPAQAVAIIMTGRELGIPTMHALRSIHVIEGKPTLSAELMLALFHRAGGTSKVVRSNAEVCEMYFQLKQTGHTEIFTIAMARAAGVTGKSGWAKYPQSMLRARCISSALRVMAPEIIAGMYDPEEMGADIAADGSVIMPKAEDAEMPTQAEERPEYAPRLDDALLVPFPFTKSAYYGLPMGDMPTAALGSFIAWAPGRQFGPQGDNALVAADMIVKARLAKEIPEPREPGDEEPPSGGMDGPHGDGTTGDEVAAERELDRVLPPIDPPPGMSENDPYNPPPLPRTVPDVKGGLPEPGSKQHPPPTSRLGRMQQISFLSTDSAVFSEAEAAQIRDRIINKITDHELATMLAEMQRRVDAFHAKGSVEAQIAAVAPREPAPE